MAEKPKKSLVKLLVYPDTSKPRWERDVITMQGYSCRQIADKLPEITQELARRVAEQLRKKARDDEDD